MACMTVRLATLKLILLSHMYSMIYEGQTLCVYVVTQ